MSKYDDEDGIVFDGWRVFPDGSYREIIPSLTDGATRIGDDELMRAELRYTYARIRLALTQEAVRVLKEQLQEERDFVDAFCARY